MSAQGVTTVKNVLLQVKVRPEDKQMIENVAELYDLDVRRFVVLAAQYIEQVKPTLEISPAGKDFAPTAKERCEHGGGCRVPPEASW